ncbi:hypothetical protein OAG71_03170, partial [bacterium]|nr:hypothetical protein [bacterium]
GAGGGIALLGTSNVSITGGFVANNESLLRGGGIFVAEDSRIQISERTEILDNVVGFQVPINEFVERMPGLGGGIFSVGTLLIKDARITDNASDGSGGGVYVADGYTRLDNVGVRRNQANISGGGLAFTGGIGLIRNSVIGGPGGIDANFAGVRGADDPIGTGGGISVSGDAIRVRVDDGSIAVNVATLSGGGIHASAGIISLVNDVQVRFNRAQLTDGGGVFIDGATSFAAVDAVFEDNAARDGAGIFNNEGRLFLSGSLVTDNDARRVAGGVFTRDFVGLVDTDISGNTAVRDADFFQEV